MSKIDLIQLVKEVRLLERHQILYHTLKRELGKIGHWRNKPRGDPAKGYKLKGSKGGK